MKKVFKLILIILVLFIVFPLESMANNKNYNNGDLRCSLNSTNCVEKKDNNGFVYEVVVTSKDDNVTIEKHVKKTNISGELKVWFQVKANKELGKIQKKANVILLFDNSKSMRYYSKGNKVIDSNNNCTKIYENVINNNNIKLDAITDDKCKKYPKAIIGAREFIENINNLSNTDMYVITFSGSGVSDAKTVDKGTNFMFPYPSSKNGTPLAGAINKAIKVIKETETALNFVVLLGDGSPTNGGSVANFTKNDATAKKITELHNNKKIYSIYTFGIGYYLETGSQEKSLNENKENAKGWFNYFQNGNENVDKFENVNDRYTVNTAFTNISNAIINEIEINNEISGSIVDNLGSNFVIKDTNESVIKTNISKISTTDFVKTDEFTIKIKEGSFDWNNTNSDFSFTYNDGNNQKNTEIKSNYDDQPQVYWKEVICSDSLTDKKEEIIKSCSGDASLDLEIKSSCQSEKKTYFDITCDELITANVKINDLKEGISKFTINKGLGFTSNIILKTDLKCNYSFYEGLYNSDKAKLETEIKNETNEKIIASKTKKLNELTSYYTEYEDYVNKLNSYKENQLSNQTAVLEVKYNDNSSDTQKFITSNFNKTKDTCTDSITSVNGYKVTTKTCSLSMEKTMILEETCLNMKDGSVENCNDSNTQIKGGNKFYTNTNKNGGEISVSIESLGFVSSINDNSNISIKLEDCKYVPGISYNDKISFRQIELSDPFLKTYTNQTREIGKNYSNDKYNFVSIIKPDIWSLSESNYKFTLNKVNVNNIRVDTNNLGVSSYLGSDCYINNLNKYVCNFFEENENNNFFTKIEK